MGSERRRCLSAMLRRPPSSAALMAAPPPPPPSATPAYLTAGGARHAPSEPRGLRGGFLRGTEEIQWVLGAAALSDVSFA